MSSNLILSLVTGKNGVAFCYLKKGQTPRERISNGVFEHLVEKYFDYALHIKYNTAGKIVELQCENDCEFLLYNSDVVKTYEFRMQSSDGTKIRLVRFQIVGARLLFRCDCEAGVRKIVCWHVKNLLSGNIQHTIELDTNEYNEFISKSAKTSMSRVISYRNQLQVYIQVRGLK